MSTLVLPRLGSASHRTVNNANFTLNLVQRQLLESTGVQFNSPDRISPIKEISPVTEAISMESIRPARELAQRPATFRFLLISAAALYLEIVLIRWLGTEVRIFAFFQNLSLIVCFLGFGVGCYSSNKRGNLLVSLGATTALVAFVSFSFMPWHSFLQAISSVLSYTPDAALWGTANFQIKSSDYAAFFACSLLIVALILMLLCLAMIPLGRWVGYYLESAPHTVTSYSINLLGSLAGIWFLAILAFLWCPPTYWFVVAFVLILFAQPFSWRSSLAACVLLAITLFALRPTKGDVVYWSPYQKLSVVESANHQYNIHVNNTGFMTIANESPDFLAKNPELAKAYQDSSYDSPFRFAKSVNRVLVVGAGAGNDVAAALRHGASEVDAVEIDPLISTLGARLHPEQPYASPKVHLINNDARNFMRNCRDKYDVVIFGLLDSHTEFSGYSNMRVDNYVYTEQSFSDAKRLLNDDGILILKFEVTSRWTWMGQRFYSMLNDVFAHPPLTYFSDTVGGLLDATVFIESSSPSLWQKSLNNQESAFLSSHPPAFPQSIQNAPPPTTDDWPYIYHYGRSIPRAYFAVSIVVLLMALYLVGPFFKPRKRSAWEFFLLGAGFMLMETQLVSRLALFFGTTWLVNCIALTGILTVLLLANVYVKQKLPKNLAIYYGCLCATLLIDFLIPWSRVPGSGSFVGTIVCFAYCVPVFFAGVIFTESFRRFHGRSDAFGANMLGAVAGGLAQNLSFIVGMKALLLIAAIVYGGAAFVGIARPRVRIV
jgi:spermidine synthase